MNIEDLINEFNNEAHKNKADSFTIEYQKTIWGMVQSVIILILVFPIMALEIAFGSDWWDVGLGGYCLYLVTHQIYGFFGALAVFRGFSKSKVKEEIIGK